MFVFVFGSNLSGIHGAGAARFARDNYGAVLHQGVGLQGNSYAIPTKDASVRNSLPLDAIHSYVKEFKKFAGDNQHMIFQITRIGCGLAGFKNSDIAPMFHCSPKNCVFDSEWEEVLGPGYSYFVSKR